MQIMIIGGGEVGSYLADLLLQQGHQIVIIDLREAAISALQRAAPRARCIHGNGTDPSLLERAGVRSVDLVAAVTGVDETNLVITSLARLVFNVPRAVARINNPHNSWMFIPEMGVDMALNQADVLAHLVAQDLA